MNHLPVSLVMFDLDGTLVDSVPDLAWCADRTLEDLGLPLVGEDKTRDYVGNGIYKLVKRFLTQQLDGEPDAALYDKALPIFWEYYRGNVSQFSQLYDGVQEALDELKAQGIKLACVTNKAEEFTQILLAHLKIDTYFEIMVGGDTLEKKKPDPMPLLHIAEVVGVAVENSLMVGDSQHDIAAARAAKMRVVAVPYGYNHGENIADSNPDAIVESLAELPALPGWIFKSQLHEGVKL